VSGLLHFKVASAVFKEPFRFTPGNFYYKKNLFTVSILGAS